MTAAIICPREQLSPFRLQRSSSPHLCSSDLDWLPLYRQEGNHLGRNGLHGLGQENILEALQAHDLSALIRVNDNH